MDGRMEVAFRKAVKMLGWRGSGARKTASTVHVYLVYISIVLEIQNAREGAFDKMRISGLGQCSRGYEQYFPVKSGRWAGSPSVAFRGEKGDPDLF